MKNYFKWIIFFLYLFAMGSIVKYYTTSSAKMNGKDRMEEKLEIDSLKVEPNPEDSLIRQDLEQTKKFVEDDY